MKRGSCLCVAVTIVAAGCSNKKEEEVPNTTFGAYAIDQKEIEYVSNKPLDLPPDIYVLVKPENPEGTQVIKPVRCILFIPNQRKTPFSAITRKRVQKLQMAITPPKKACLKNYSIGSGFSGSSCLGYDVTLAQLPDQFFVM